MSDTIDTSNAPPVPPEVEQAVLMGHIPEAIGSYITHTGAERDIAEAVVGRLVEEHA
jgi:hypothetical protein